MSSETKWTPAPWVVEDNPTVIGQQVAAFEKSGDMAGNRCLQVIVNSHCESDAHLIAAAPDLYEVLETAVRQGERILAGDEPEEGEDFDGWFLSAKAALAKARGEQS